MNVNIQLSLQGPPVVYLPFQDSGRYLDSGEIVLIVYVYSLLRLLFTDRMCGEHRLLPDDLVQGATWTTNLCSACLNESIFI
jgi:hypothetical protein